jgi:tRNA(Met) cytidine acetyltransferase
MRCARVVRIAVHPALQRRGLGRRMLELLATDRQGGGFDLLGASFGASPELLGFWAAQALHPVRLGFSRGAASGMHALLVLRGLSPQGQTLVQSARSRFREQFPELLWGPLRELEPRLALELLFRCAPSAPPGLSDGEWRELAAFAFAARPLEDSLPLLRRWLLALCHASAVPRESDSDLLLAVFLQGHSPKAVAKAFGAAGRAAVLRRLRGAVGALLRQTAPASLGDAMSLPDIGNGST